MHTTFRQIIFFLCLFLFCSPQALLAETNSPINPDYYFTTNFAKAKASPTFSMAAPSGFSPNKPVVFFGIGGITDISGTPKKTDGSMAVGYGTNLPFADLGAAFTLDLGSINPADGGMFNRGDLGISVGKFVQSLGIGVSLGVKNITLWYASAGKNTPSSYLAATKIYKFKDSMIIINGGLGNNAYRTITDSSPRSERSKKVSLFASAAYYPVPQLSFVADNTAGITTLGLGIVPIAAWPVSISLGLYDVGKTIPDRSKTSLVGSLSTSYTF
ncbi:MAG: hypothetical protein R8M14_09970 [Ghiorsea sp.]